MRKLILQMGVSIDGFVAAPDGGQPWLATPEAQEAKRRKLETVSGASAHLMGRVTYGHMASAWPTSDSDYAAPMNEIPKVVFSKTLERADWPESRIASGDLAEEVAALKEEPGEYMIAYGGAGLAQALSREGLVDEYRLTIHPMALGEGMPIFADLPGVLELELLESHPYASGTVANVYRPKERR